MKKMMTLAMMMVMTITATAMSYNKAKKEALFLSDKMAYELNLNAAQYEAVYEINLDYLMSVNDMSDVFGAWWSRRNADLRYVLTDFQYAKYAGLHYFYRPITWNAGSWAFSIYRRYNKAKFFNARPAAFRSYKGGNNRVQGTHYAKVNPAKPAPAKPVNNKNVAKNNKAANGKAPVSKPANNKAMNDKRMNDKGRNTVNNHQVEMNGKGNLQGRR